MSRKDTTAQVIADKMSGLQTLDLLSLPEEVLQNVARHFTLAEWLQGPARACRFLHCMELPRVDLIYYRAQFVKPEPLHMTANVCHTKGHFLQPTPKDLLKSATRLLLLVLAQSCQNVAALCALTGCIGG